MADSIANSSDGCADGFPDGYGPCIDVFHEVTTSASLGAVCASPPGLAQCDEPACHHARRSGRRFSNGLRLTLTCVAFLPRSGGQGASARRTLRHQPRRRDVRAGRPGDAVRVPVQRPFDHDRRRGVDDRAERSLASSRTEEPGPVVTLKRLVGATVNVFVTGAPDSRTNVIVTSAGDVPGLASRTYVSYPSAPPTRPSASPQSTAAVVRRRWRALRSHWLGVNGQYARVRRRSAASR